MKKLITLFLSVFLILALAGFALTEAAEAPRTGWPERLSGLDGVTSVVELPANGKDPLYHTKLLVTFEQPLDWKNPEAGTFPQRALICLREGAAVNVLRTEGYVLIDAVMENKVSNPMEYLTNPDVVPEPARMLEANLIMMEHRFFGKSRPEWLSNDEVKGWECFTAENAANDYHRIYTALSPLLPGKWVASGASRGGDVTNTYGYFFPDDMDVYMPYVAPSGMVNEDPRFYPFISNEIGNAAFGEEKAAEMRALLLSFQVMMLKHKQTLMPQYEAAVQQFGCLYRPQVDPGVIYDLNVLEFATQYWQYQRVPFEDIQKIMDMPETSEEELRSKLSSAMKLMITLQSPEDFSATSVAWPYYVSAATTYGHFRYDFSFLRRALEEAGLENTLSVTEEMEDGLIRNTVFTEEQKAAFAYDGSYRQAMLEALKTTDAKYLMIYGATDPWTSLGIAECANPNVKICMHPTMPHRATISSMPAEMREEITALLKAWLAP